MVFYRLTYGSIFSCVELSVSGRYNVLSLKKTKKELTIVNSQEYLDLDSLVDGLQGYKHVFLIVNNSQVLIKNIEATHIAKESAVKAAFPNINLKEFYYDVLEIDGASLVSVCRKEVVNTIIRELSEKGISTLQFSLGNTSFDQLLPFVVDSEFYTSNGVFKVENQKITRWNKQSPIKANYDINGLNISTRDALPLSGVLSYYRGVEIPEGDESRQSLFNTYRQKRIFHIGIRLGLGLLLVSLLINFFVFSSRRNEVSNLNEELAISEAYRKQLLSLDEIVGKKKQLVESMDAASSSKVIWYMDRIASSVPNTVSLDQISYQPLSRVIRKDKSVLFLTDKVIITGNAKDDNDLTKWLSELENTKWVSKVVVNLGSKNTRLTSFDLLVHLKRDER